MIYVVFALIIVGLAIFSLRFAWWRADIDLKYPRVLMYHMISEHLPKNASKFNRLRVKPKEFEKQLDWLKENGFKSYFLSEISSELPEKSVIMTFDDGYKDNLTNALPLLKKYNFKANIFIVTNRFNRDWAHDRDTAKSSSELNNEEMLSDDEVKILLDSGLAEIGSHTLDHVNLPSLSDSEKELQMSISKQEIEKKFGIKCETFAYPFGFFDKSSVEIAKKHYKFATTTHNDVYKSSYNNHEIPRIMISGRGGILNFILKIKKGRDR